MLGTVNKINTLAREDGKMVGTVNKMVGTVNKINTLTREDGKMVGTVNSIIAGTDAGTDGYQGRLTSYGQQTGLIILNDEPCYCFLFFYYDSCYAK